MTHAGSEDLGDALHALDAQGFLLLPGILAPNEVADCLTQLTSALEQPREESEAIRGREGSVYAARNVLDWFPAAQSIWRAPRLENLLRGVLGDRFGLVRALYFDKHPERIWALPWHQDLTIAVREHPAASDRFMHPTRKAGVPHLEAPVELLEQMLTLRIHLDEVTDENGPLRVLAGSHRAGKGVTADLSGETTIHAAPGDVLAMRPLLAHASGASDALTARHRRILHFEFAASPELPDGIVWHTFLPGQPA